MGKFGQQPINDASKKPPRIAFTHHETGEQRIEVRPNGRVEQFVDPDGHVVSIHLASLGTPAAQEVADKKRMQHRRDGFVEYAKCPVKHGSRHATPALEKSFENLPEALQKPCAADPKVMIRTATGIESRPPCEHIQWLIAQRKADKAKSDAKHNANWMAQEKLAKEREELQGVQLDIAKEQLAELRARNAKKGAKADPA